MSATDESKQSENPFSGNEYILGTPLQWSWLEEKLCTSLHTNAKFGNDRSAQQIGVGQGYTSVMARIQPKWVGSDDQLPHSIIAKISSLKTVREMVNDNRVFEEFIENANMNETLDSFENFLSYFHNTEVSLYEMIQANNLHLKVPKTYILQEFNNQCPQGVVVMEDMGEESVVVPSYDTLSVGDIYQIMDQLAELHKFSYECSNWSSSIGTVTMASFVQKVSQKKTFISLLQSLRYLDESMAPKLNRITELWDSIFDTNTLDNLHNTLGIPPVIVHGDLWVSNIIWKERNGKRTLAAIVDWQVTHPGCAAEDIGRIVSCSLTAKDRREHWRDILKYYYSKLKEKMQKEPPLSFQKLEESFIRMYPFTMCAVLSVFGPGMRFDIEMKFPNRTDELVAVLREKAIGVVDDILYYHSLNIAKQSIH